MPDPLTGAVPPVPACLRPALRVDPLLVGDWAGISAVLARCSPPYPLTLAGCHAFIADWVQRMRPLYLMASTPHGFSLPPASSASSASTALTAIASSATAAATPAAAAASGAEPPTRAQLLEEVLLRVAAEEGLPIALKVGAVRGANPALRGGGDAMEVADLSFVRQLCVRYPHVKFLLTVLSRDNQHELCVLSQTLFHLSLILTLTLTLPPTLTLTPTQNLTLTLILTLPPTLTLVRARAEIYRCPQQVRARAQVWQPAHLRLVVVLQQPIDHRGHDAHAPRDARHRLHLPAQRLPRARSAPVQVATLARGHLPAARRAVLTLTQTQTRTRTPIPNPNPTRTR